MSLPLPVEQFILLFVPIILALTAILIISKLRHRRASPPLPPGPPGEPFLGNIRALPSKDFDLYLHDLGKYYGDVTYLNLLGKGVLVLNRLSAAVNLLEKRGSKYSGRPRFPLAEVQESSDMLLFLDYGADFRLHRRVLHQFLQKDNITQERYMEVYTREARNLTQRLAAHPNEWMNHLMMCSTSVIIELAFGHQIETKDDPYLRIISDFCEHAATCVKPEGGALVEFWPSLKCLPSWFPGGYWIGRARESRRYVRKFKEYPYETVEREMSKDAARPCFLSTQIEGLRNGKAHPALTKDHIRSMACVLYIAGADTTSSSLANFFASMVMHPEYQEKAQGEIDRVIGEDRPLTLEDRSSLPLVEGIVQETLRWHPPVPLAVPHCTTEDDIYGDAYIPKGTTIVPNIRGMALDDEVYKDPYTFDPERFARGEPLFDAVWGFGRRMCPGRHLAEQSLWISIATILATLRILRPLDPSGKEYVPQIEFETGITCRPLPFACRIQGRVSQKKKSIIESI